MTQIEKYIEHLKTLQNLYEEGQPQHKAFGIAIVEANEMLVKSCSIPDVGNCADIEEPFFDEKGREIKEFAVLKVYHFSGVNEQGRGRKHYYMYKWVKLKEHKGKKYWVAMHLTNDRESSYYNLCAVADKQTRIIEGTEIVQQH